MTDSAADPHVVFAHGKESGPWGSKIQRLAGVAGDQRFRVTSPDYQDAADPLARCRQLETLAPAGAPLVLVGSSMGGYVSAMACAQLRPAALLLMAPALYLDGYPGEPSHCPADTVVVHGWQDNVVPVAGSLAFARPRRATLVLVNDSHRLAASLDTIADLFAAQLERTLKR